MPRIDRSFVGQTMKEIGLGGVRIIRLALVGFPGRHEEHKRSRGAQLAHVCQWKFRITGPRLPES